MNIEDIGMTGTLKFWFLTQVCKTLVDYVGGDNAIYIGLASPGSKVRNAKWQIARMNYDGDDNLIAIRYANGSLGFDYRWTRRTTYTYS